MNFSLEQAVTLIVAALMSSPAWIGAYKSWRESKKKDTIDYQKRLMVLTDIVTQLLALISIYDAIMQKIFILNPEVNDGTQIDWATANKTLVELRAKIKEL